MLPRDKRGVVDHKLKVWFAIICLGLCAYNVDKKQVYGTTNLRVVDVSIVPLHVAAHTQSKHYRDIAYIL